MSIGRYLELKKVVYKKQFRLYDVYRYAATGEESKIQGIDTYECNRDATTIVIRYEFGPSQTFFAKNERELRDVIKHINKTLGNCDIPGPKVRRYDSK